MQAGLAWSGARNTVVELVLTCPLQVEANESAVVRISSTMAAPRRTFMIDSSRDRGSSWTTHATGVLARAPVAAPPPVALPPARRDLPQLRRSAALP